MPSKVAAHNRSRSPPVEDDDRFSFQLRTRQCLSNQYSNQYSRRPRHQRALRRQATAGYIHREPRSMTQPRLVTTRQGHGNSGPQHRITEISGITEPPASTESRLQPSDRSQSDRLHHSSEFRPTRKVPKRLATYNPQSGVPKGILPGRNVRSKCRCSCPAIHTTTRSLLRPSSTHEPSDPPPRVRVNVHGTYHFIPIPRDMQETRD